MPDTIFEAHALTKTYISGEVTVQALRGLDLEVRAKEVVVLLGPSGSGKSTLLNIMGGLDRATSGSLFFKDADLTKLDERGLTLYRRNHVGFVFQFYNLVPSLTAYENVALVTEIAERPMAPEEALALVGLQTRMDHFPAQLSGEFDHTEVELVRWQGSGDVAAMSRANCFLVVPPDRERLAAGEMVSVLPRGS